MSNTQRLRGACVAGCECQTVAFAAWTSNRSRCTCGIGPSTRGRLQGRRTVPLAELRNMSVYAPIRVDVGEAQATMLHRQQNLTVLIL